MQDFKKLSDNDQLTWLESLFYLDTPTKMASSKLVKSRPAGPPAQVEMPRRREKSALSLYRSDKSNNIKASQHLLSQQNMQRI